MTGYTDCACPDCFEIAIGTPGEAFCNACEAADCDGASECEAPHAYCGSDEKSGDDDVMVDGVAYCPVCGQEF